MNKYFETLRMVERPSRYMGAEIHSVNKTQYDTHFLFAFPDLYDVGMSHLGMHILYALLNQRADVFCERIFAPADDMAELIRQKKAPFVSLESHTPLKDFDIIGFTLQYEMSYTTILWMLSLGEIPLKSCDRSEEDPLIIAGGPCAFNPEPMADFFDLYLIGDAEEVLPELMELWKKRISKKDFLKQAVKLAGIYVPAFYEPQYEGGILTGYRVLEEGAPYPVKKALLKSLQGSFYPDSLILPYLDTVHNRGVMEVFRGCTKGCRFCQAGMIYRPVRERSLEEIERHIEHIMESGGYREFSLSSLSTLDYSKIGPLVDDLTKRYEKDEVSISLPSLRLDSFSLDVLKKVAKVRKSSLTFAPEAGTQRLRDVINKNVREEDIYGTIRQVFDLGWQKIKLYFMLGLPSETFADVQGIETIAKSLVKYYHSDGHMGPLNITVSTSSLVPKPFTPFQWVEQVSEETLRIRQEYLKKHLRGQSLSYNYHDIHTTSIEGVIARGGREMGALLRKVFETGGYMESWREHFSFERWLEAMHSLEMSLDEIRAAIPTDRFLPWDIIDAGIDKDYLLKEYENALASQATADCRDGCLGCGINSQRIGGICFER